ncbi:SMODS domain-containing nucleotidyltransferase, partial [Salmonella enterica]|uniref:SMODS domain-containing nucleotidyltransferase n=1 Tax=Salmonella enterica TaxID=28901 RepID=UPI003F7654C9|nr:nucleotidyltransferase [Salmonella enterica subsp. enterica serovar Typhimurium]
LDRLRRFAELRYASSEVAQSHPTVALELNHIRFELVPALKSWFSGLQIPAKGSDYQSWQDTDPNGFNEKLVNANQANANLIKPLVRIMKYW